MSSTVKKKGLIVPLLFPISNKDTLEEIQEMLWDNKSNLSINSEGTLVYSDIFRHVNWDEREDIYGLSVGSFDLQSVEDFVEEINNWGFLIDEEKIEDYSEIYHNSGDSGISLLTLKEYTDKFDKLWEGR